MESPGHKTVTETGEDWARLREVGTRKVLAAGTLCTGKGLALLKKGKEAGTQLSLADGGRLEKKLRLVAIRRPEVSYLVLKFVAELLEAFAELELRNAAVHGKKADLRLRSVRVLGILNKTFFAPGHQKALEEAAKKGADAKPEGVFGGISGADIEAVLETIAKLPKMRLRHDLESAIKKKALLNMIKLSEIMYVLGMALELPDPIVQAQLETLAQTPEQILVEEDVDHYYGKVLEIKKASGRPLAAILDYGPKLAKEFGSIEKGTVVLKRINAAAGVRPLQEDWASIKIIAILYDVLAHMPDGDIAKIQAVPGARARLGCLGGLDRTFLRHEQKKYILKGKRSHIDDAELSVLKELSVHAKFASIDPKRRVTKAGRKIQKHILENYLFNLAELVELFTDLSHRFYVPLDLYKLLVKKLAKQKMITEAYATEVLGKVTAEERLKGVHLFNVVPYFTVLETWGAEQEGSEHSVAEKVEVIEEISPTGADLQVPMLLLHDFVILKKRGPRRSEFHMEAYQKALDYLQRAELRGDKKTGIGYIKSAVERKRPLPLVELSAVLNLMGSGNCIDKERFNALLADLVKEKLISKSVHDTLASSTQLPISPIALRTIFDKLIKEHD